MANDRLAPFLQRAAGRRFQLGEFDCGLFLSDWCFEVHGIDPTASLRGKYSSADEVQRLVGVSNLPHAFGRMLFAAGFRLTKTPVYGDVAMIKPAGSDICGAIVTTGYVVLTRGGGLSRIRQDRARLVVAWSVWQWGAAVRGVNGHLAPSDYAKRLRTIRRMPADGYARVGDRNLTT